jgi:hypothetical protein
MSETPTTNAQPEEAPSVRSSAPRINEEAAAVPRPARDPSLAAGASRRRTTQE